MARRSLLALTVLTVFAVFVSAAAGATPPKLYKGSVTGSVVETEIGDDVFNPVTTTDTFEITGLKLKRVAYGTHLSGKRAIYKVTGGSVHWTQTAVGRCTHTIEQTFPLAKSVDKTSAPLAFDYYRKVWKILGALHVTKVFTVTDTCTFSDGYVMPRELNVAPPALFAVGRSSLKQSPRPKIKRTFKDAIKDSSSSRTSSWKLDIKS